jgi:hypothetical protein
MAAQVLWAQQTIYDEARILYRKEMVGGIMVHGDGWGLLFQHMKHRTAKDRRVLGVDIVSMRHPKEVKSFNPYYEESRGYFYGKSYSMLVLRPIFGRKHQVADKIRRSGVEVNTIWGVGPSIALLKPVYLQIGKPDNFPYETVVVERYDPTLHGVQNIYGRASWFTGVGEMRPYVGLHGRFGFNFEHSGQADGVKALEAGAAIDAYPQVLPIMAQVEGVVNKRIFLQFYIALQFGKKFIQ